MCFVYDFYAVIIKQWWMDIVTLPTILSITQSEPSNNSYPWYPCLLLPCKVERPVPIDLVAIFYFPSVPLIVQVCLCGVDML